MTQQQIEEKKAEQEVFSQHRAAQKRAFKLRKLMGNKEYGEYIHYKVMKGAEEYCRTHPGVRIVPVGDGFTLKDTGDVAQP